MHVGTIHYLRFTYYNNVTWPDFSNDKSRDVNIGAPQKFVHTVGAIFIKFNINSLHHWISKFAENSLGFCKRALNRRDKSIKNWSMILWWPTGPSKRLIMKPSVAILSQINNVCGTLVIVAQQDGSIRQNLLDGCFVPKFKVLMVLQLEPTMMPPIKFKLKLGHIKFDQR